MPTLLGAVVFLALCAGTIIPLERIFPKRGHRQPALAALLCVVLFVGNTLLMNALAPALLAPLERWCDSSEAATPGRLIAAFVLADLLGYLLHRAMHRVPWLWRIHRVHHASVGLNWLEAWRQHPVDFVLHGVAAGIPGAVLGASLSDVIALVLIRKAWTSFLHADVSVRFGLLERVVATPAFHHRHHESQVGRNFAGTFPFWDALFGTEAIIGSDPPGGVGVERIACPGVPSGGGVASHL